VLLIPNLWLLGLKISFQRHDLLRSEGSSKEEDGPEAIGFQGKGADAGVRLNVRICVEFNTESANQDRQQRDLDTELGPLISQLRSHLDSMQSNATEVGGMSEALVRASAALDDMLYSHLDSER